MEEGGNTTVNWIICLACQGRGKTSRRLRKKVRLQYQRAVAEYEKSKVNGPPPSRPKAGTIPCLTCSGSGLVPTDCPPKPDTENLPHVAIIGAGIGGTALAAACLQRKIPFTLYERDTSFDARSQGYGLTLQQASKAIKSFGISRLEQGVVSTKHVMHKTDGTVIGEWGMRKWKPENEKASPKKSNVHIARQALRLALLEQVARPADIQWGHQLLDYRTAETEGIELRFRVDGEVKKARADLLVGADGIRSTVRNLLIGEAASPLQYLGCIVILGICPLKNIEGVESALLDSATVFQTANGHERIYMMPYTADTIMWQLSFPMPEDKAKALSAQGTLALHQEACRRTPWHHPIPQILAATDIDLISGYPVYDRRLLTPNDFMSAGNITLIGDAAHPMSPFKGQGANQALLDALLLAQGITHGCKAKSNWKEAGIRNCVLTDYESEMLQRTATKVKDSAAAAKFLHSDAVLTKRDGPRGGD